MRCVLVLMLLAPMAIATAAAPPRARAPRLDVNGDPLPNGAIARLGSVRFQPTDPYDGAGKRWRWHNQPVGVALSPDGTTLAAANAGDRGAWIDVLDASTGKIVRKLDVANVSAQRMQFSPDGKSLLVCDWSGGIHTVHLRTGKVARTSKIDLLGQSALSTDGKLLAAQPKKHVRHAPVVVWDVRTAKEVASLPGRGTSCKALMFGPEAKRLLLWSLVPWHVTADSISFDPRSAEALACIDLPTRKIVGEATVGPTQLVALCPDGETVAVGTPGHKSVRVRHLPTGVDRCDIPAKASALAFAPDGKVLLTIDDDGLGTLWNARTGDKVRDLEGALANKDFALCGISKDGRTLAVLDGGWESAARLVVWNAATGKRIGRPDGHDGTVTCIAYGPGGKVLASGSIDRTVRLWDPVTGKHLRLLARHKGAITAVALSPDGKLVASSSKSGVTLLSRATDGKAVAELAGPEKGATALLFSPDGKVLFMGGQSPEVLAYEVAGGKEVLRLPTGDDGAVMALGTGGAFALTANGEIRAEPMSERLRVWDLTEKRPASSCPIRDQRGGIVRCDAAIFSQDGRMLASSQVSVYHGIRPSYGAAQLRLWERVSGEPIRTLAPVITPVLAFSPSARLLACTGAGTSGHLSVGYGTGLDFWDTLTGTKAGTLPVTPQCVAFSPDGTRVATGGRDHCVLIWEAPNTRQRKGAKAPSPAERDAWWTALGGQASEAYKAIAQLAGAPEHATALLKERVTPVKPCDPDAAAKLIAQLGSKEFDVRQKAEAALEKMGESVAHHLVKALEGATDLEVVRRTERLIAKCNRTSTTSMRHQRAVAALEWIGTPAARALLRHLAAGAPGASLTIEARAALNRLEH
jgi:WD40 repeat protein